MKTSIPITDAIVVPVEGKRFKTAKAFFEKAFVNRLLLKHKGNMVICAKDAGMTKRGFHYMCDRHGISMKRIKRYKRLG